MRSVTINYFFVKLKLNRGIYGYSPHETALCDLKAYIEEQLKLSYLTFSFRGTWLLNWRAFLFLYIFNKIVQFRRFCCVAKHDCFFSIKNYDSRALHAKDKM